MASTPHVPVRTCVGCRERAPRAHLLRLVLTSGGVLDVDPRAIMPGRGAWIHLDSRCLALAERRRSLERALRAGEPLDTGMVQRWLAGRLNEDPVVRPDGRQTDCKGG